MPIDAEQTPFNKTQPRNLSARDVFVILFSGIATVVLWYIMLWNFVHFGSDLSTKAELVGIVGWFTFTFIYFWTVIFIVNAAPLISKNLSIRPKVLPWLVAGLFVAVPIIGGNFTSFAQTQIATAQGYEFCTDRNSRSGFLGINLTTFYYTKNSKNDTCLVLRGLKQPTFTFGQSNP